MVNANAARPQGNHAKFARHSVQQGCIAYMRWMISTVGIPFERVRDAAASGADPTSDAELSSALKVGVVTNSWEWLAHTSAALSRHAAERMLESLADEAASFRARKRIQRRDETNAEPATLPVPRKLPIADARAYDARTLQPTPIPTRELRRECAAMLQSAIATGVTLTQVLNTLRSELGTRMNEELEEAVKLGADTDEWEWAEYSCKSLPRGTAREVCARLRCLQ